MPNRSSIENFEDPEGCRHEDYYLKVAQGAIKKPSQATTMMGFGDNRMLNGSQPIAKARHGAAVGAARYKPIMVPYCDVAMSSGVAAHIAITREVVLSIRIRHLNPTPANPKRLKTATGGLHVFWKATSIRGR